MAKKVLITAALPYANGILHFGHMAGAYLPADCYSRFQKLIGNDAIYICGSDEYGIAILLSAEKAKRTPQEQVDIFHEINKKVFAKFSICFDHYSRTTIKEHIPLVQQFFIDLQKNGYIEEKEAEHLYSEEEQRFLADRYVEGECPHCHYQQARGDECPKCARSFDAKDLLHPVSNLTKKKLSLRKSRHWYLRFDLFKEKLQKWIKTKPWKSNVLNFTKSYIDNLQERGITRDSTWGVPLPLPDAQDKVFYVWFDAPIGYISATQEWSRNMQKPEKWKEYWCDKETKLVQFIGKDNIPFHTVFFPAMIMGQDQPFNLVDDVPANEFLLLEGRQFSKTDNWYIDLDGFFQNFTADQIRYYLAAIAPETADAEFTWKDFQQRCNADLLGKFGNYIHRTLVFAKKYTDSKIPPIGDMDKDDQRFLKEIEDLSFAMYQAYDQYQLRKATQILMELAHKANTYFDHKKPWSLAKEEKTQHKMYTCIALCLHCIKALAVMAYPIIPTTSTKIWKMLGMQTDIAKENWRIVLSSSLAVGQNLQEPEILFSKIEDVLIEEELAKLQKN